MTKNKKKKKRKGKTGTVNSQPQGSALKETGQ